MFEWNLVKLFATVTEQEQLCWSQYRALCRGHTANPTRLTLLSVLCTVDRGWLWSLISLAVLHHWGECPLVPKLSPGVQGDWLPVSLRGRQVGSGQAAARAEEFRHQLHYRLFRAQSRLRGGEDSAVGPVQVCQGQPQGMGGILACRSPSPHIMIIIVVVVVSGTGTHAFIISLNLSVINKWHHQLSKLILANQIEPNVNRNHVLPRDVNEKRGGRWARRVWAWEIIIKGDVCGN